MSADLALRVARDSIIASAQVYAPVPAARDAEDAVSRWLTSRPQPRGWGYGSLSAARAYPGGWAVKQEIFVTLDAASCASRPFQDVLADVRRILGEAEATLREAASRVMEVPNG